MHVSIPKVTLAICMLGSNLQRVLGPFRRAW
jgi:hypothetical protein